MIQLKFWQHFIQRFYPPRPLAARNQGWTLIEMAVVSVIIGILSSIAIPSMMSGKGKSDLRSAMGQVKGAIQEAQRSAIKNGQSCTVRIISNRITGSPAGCITSPVTLSSDITVNDGAAISNFSFSYKGNTTSDRTIYLSSNRTSQKYCLVISSGIGIMRTGTYSGTTCTSSF